MDQGIDDLATADGGVADGEGTLNHAQVRPQQAAKAAPKRRKRRTREQLELETHLRDHSMMSLADKRRDAANSRWRKVRESKASERSFNDLTGRQAPEAAAALVAQERQMVEMEPPLQVAEVELSKFPMEITELQPLAQDVLSFAAETPAAYKEELDVFNHMSRLASLSSVGIALKRDERTVRRTARLMAVVIVLSKKWRKLGSVQRIHQHLRTICEAESADFTALQFLLKDKYDEVSLPVKQLEEIRQRQGNTGPIVPGAKHTVTAKLVMLKVSEHYLWRVAGKYVTARFQDANIMIPVEATTPECMLGARKTQLPDLSWQRATFKICGRLAIRDDHPSNGVMDYAMFQLLPWLPPTVFICKLHKQFKTAEILLRPFDLDRMGLVHSTLSFQFGGAFTIWKQAAMKIVEDTLVFRMFGVEGAGPLAAAYREHVEALYCTVSEAAISGPGVAALRARLLAKRELLNGNYQLEFVVEHWSNGISTRDRKHAISRINEECIRPLEIPKVWNLKKWLGPKQSFDFHGEWSATHDLLGRSYQLAYDTEYYLKHRVRAEDAAAAAAGLPGGAAAAAGADHETDGAGPILYAIPIADGDLCHDSVDVHDVDATEKAEMDEPTSLATAWERQSTYRGNASRWHRTRPAGRYPALRQIHAVQQDAICHMMGQAGAAFEAIEVQRRCKSEPPRYRGAMIQAGKYTNDSLERYATLIREPAHWHILRPESRTHALSNACLRSCMGAAAITEQLQKAREVTWPFLPYGIVNAKSYQGKVRVADEMVADKEEFGCKIPPYWTEYLRQYPTTAAITSTALGGTLEH